MALLKNLDMFDFADSKDDNFSIAAKKVTLAYFEKFVSRNPYLKVDLNLIDPNFFHQNDKFLVETKFKVVKFSGSVGKDFTGIIALADFNNTIIAFAWIKNGKLHSDTGPALLSLSPNMFTNGIGSFYARNGLLKYVKEWWKSEYCSEWNKLLDINPFLHNPTNLDLTRDGVYYSQEHQRFSYFYKGQLHNLDGPAVIGPKEDSLEYYIHGVKYSYVEYLKQISLHVEKLLLNAPDQTGSNGYGTSAQSLNGPKSTGAVVEPINKESVKGKNKMSIDMKDEMRQALLRGTIRKIREMFVSTIANLLAKDMTDPAAARVMVAEMLRTPYGNSILSVAVGSAIPLVAQQLPAEYAGYVNEAAREFRVSGGADLVYELSGVAFDLGSTLVGEIKGNLEQLKAFDEKAEAELEKHRIEVEHRIALTSEKDHEHEHEVLKAQLREVAAK